MIKLEIEMVVTGQLKPNWNVEKFRQLDFEYKDEGKNDSELLQKYRLAGHPYTHIGLHMNYDPKPCPYNVDKELQKQLAIDNINLSVNLLEPGCYLPFHTDGFKKYSERNAISQSITWYRFLIMLEDSEPGQIIQTVTSTWGNWQAGFYIRFEETDWHAVYNFSLKSRYALQVTATLI